VSILLTAADTGSSWRCSLRGVGPRPLESVGVAGWHEGWPINPMDAARRIDERYAGREASTMFLWAVWTVEGLDYLADIDAELPASPHRHNHEAVDLAHARWAAVDAVTAIDLCAAALGRMHRDYPNRGFEMDFGDARKDTPLLALHAPGAWISAVDGDRVRAGS
jgi:hypothetical protein